MAEDPDDLIPEELGDVLLDEPRIGLRLQTKDGKPHVFHMTSKKARAIGERLIAWANKVDREMDDKEAADA